MGDLYTGDRGGEGEGHFCLQSENPRRRDIEIRLAHTPDEGFPPPLVLRLEHTGRTRVTIVANLVTFPSRLFPVNHRDPS